MKNLSDDEDIPLFKDREELLETIYMYENWFESLIDSKVCIEIKIKKKTKHVDATVSKFIANIGWKAYDYEGNEYNITFNDFVTKKVILV